MTSAPELDASALPPRRDLALLLGDHHARLAGLCRELIERGAVEDTRSLAHDWRALEAELLAHMTAEEEVLLPSYAERAPTDARRLREDHDRIRALLMPIGIDLELHEIRLARLAHLVEALDAHALDEDTGMYPWATRHVALVNQRMLFDRIDRAFART